MCTRWVLAVGTGVERPSERLARRIRVEPRFRPVTGEDNAGGFPGTMGKAMLVADPRLWESVCRCPGCREDGPSPESRDEVMAEEAV